MKPLSEQVVVITGASSGIGRAAALTCADKGASVVLAARNSEALEEVARSVRARGGEALVVETDVALWPQVERLAREAVARFGRIDTWVNNAAVSEYATLEGLPVSDMERIIQVNLLGTMYGIKAALPVMVGQKSGTIINVGSGLGVRSIPLQGTYCATKAAVKGITEALRVELARDHPDINATLILPGAINTPFYENVRARMGGPAPQPIPPLYPAQSVADAIAFCAEHVRRDVYVGSTSKSLAVLENTSPALLDWMMSRALFKVQQGGEDSPHRPDNLDGSVPGPGRVEGKWDSLTKSGSVYTKMFALHPRRTRLLSLAALAGAALLARRVTSRPDGYLDANTPSPAPDGGTQSDIQRKPTTMSEYTHSAAVTINAPVSQVYQLFTHFNDFPKFMSYIKEVTYKDAQTSHWVAEVVGNQEWDAVNEGWVENKQIGWRSIEGIQNHGAATFETVGDSQTKVSVSISYTPPAGILGDAGEKLGVGKAFETKLQHDLDHFAQLVAQTPSGALDPESSNYLFHDDSAAAKGKTTTAQDSTMGNSI